MNASSTAPSAFPSPANAIFSSFLGGCSGNRGRCAQPCRRLYRYRGKEGYYFSPNDFSSIDMLPELVDAGVSSFKIEGRMKSAEYVASVVGAYRMVLDADPPGANGLGRGQGTAEAILRPRPDPGFLASHQPTDIATPSLSGATGRFLGEIRAVLGERITFETRDRLHLGDRIRVQPKSDKAGKAFTVKEIFGEKAGEVCAGAARLPSPPPSTLGRRCGLQGLLGNSLHHERKRLPQAAGIGKAAARWGVTWQFAHQERASRHQRCSCRVAGISLISPWLG